MKNKNIKSAGKQPDKSGMREVILKFPLQFENGIKAAEKIQISEKFNQAFICGMGGSALAGILFKNWLDLENKFFPIHIIQNYSLPKITDKNSLVICVSYSGNTEETLSCYQYAVKNGLTVVSISADGKLKDLSEQNKTPFVQISLANIEPRSAAGYMFGALSAIFENAGIIQGLNKIIIDSEKNLAPKKSEKEGILLAEKIGKKIPLIYASQEYEPIARNWKIGFNENSKTHAFYNVFPELNHNEIAGFSSKTNSKTFHIIILNSGSEHPRIIKRIKLTAKLLKERDHNVDFVRIKGKTNFEKIFNTVILGEWTSYWLAVQKSIDPSPVEIIEKFKKLMA